MSFKKPVPPPKSVSLDDEDTETHEEPLPSVMVLSIPNGLVLQYCEKQEDAGLLRCYSGAELDVSLYIVRSTELVIL